MSSIKLCKQVLVSVCVVAVMDFRLSLCVAARALQSLIEEMGRHGHAEC